MMRSMSRLVVAAAVCAAGVASAETVRFSFSGTITNIFGNAPVPAGVVIGATWTASYEFDTAAVDTTSATNLGTYECAQWQIVLGSYELHGVPGSISVLNNGIAGDTYSVTTTHDVAHTQIGLTDFQEAAFPNDGLPSNLVASQFEATGFSLHVMMGATYWQAEGTLTEFSSEVLASCNADYNQDGGADTADILDLANDIASGQQRFPPSTPDFNQDGGADVADVIDIANTVASSACP